MSKFEKITILEKPRMYLREVQHDLLRITQSWYDCATICHTIKRLSMTGQKKKSLVARQRCEVRRAQYISEIMEFNPKSLIFIEETGSSCRNTIY